METQHIHAVTGAFGYSGKYLAQKLISKNKKVITLTNSFQRTNPFGEIVKAYPFYFDEPEKLTEQLRDVEVLYNTYWVRFNHKDFTHQMAVNNTLILFECAKKAGVKKIVHVSITNPSINSHLEYFKGKAILEKALIESGISYSILRPTVIFGKEDILINNIAWMIRKFPMMGVFGDGNYRLQPIYVEDLADLAVAKGEETENKIIDAIGLETYTYRNLIKTISEIIGVKRKIISVSPSFGYLIGKMISLIKGDIMITREEIDGLSADLLYTKSQPVGKTKLSDWIKKHAAELGQNYANELTRRSDRKTAY